MKEGLHSEISNLLFIEWIHLDKSQFEIQQGLTSCQLLE